MDAWYEGVRAGGGLQRAIGFDSHMEHRDWESAKGSIVRTYGRSSREHQLTLDTLSAAIHYRRVLGAGQGLMTQDLVSSSAQS